jgi:hypothetical protein
MEKLSLTTPGRTPAEVAGSRAHRLSYKYQRLRERLRGEVASGQLAGKLPGERELAKRFGANAKTLSKALTDLAAEGLLERSIGRGTFVRGSAPAAAPSSDRWLLVCQPHQLDWMVVRHLVEVENPQSQIITDIATARPSYLSGFKAVINIAENTPDRFIHDLIVRGMPLVNVGSECRTFSTHAVVLDRTLAATVMGRRLMLAGHRRIVAVAPRMRTTICDALRQAALQYAPDADIDSCPPNDAEQAVACGATALVVDGHLEARDIAHQLRTGGREVPGHVSVTGIGCIRDVPQCSGYFATGTEKAQAVAKLLRDRPTRPVTLWLAGQIMDAGTMALASGAEIRALPVGADAPRTTLRVL